MYSDGRAAALTDVKDFMTRQRTSSPSNHEIQFVAHTGVDASSDTITLVFGTGFDLTGIDASEVALSHGATTGFETSETLAASAAAGVWGVGVSSQTITLTPPTDTASGEISAGQRVVIRIGTLAGGVSQIVNPSTAGTHELTIGGVFGDTGQLFISIVSADSLTVSATVPAASVGGGSTGGGSTGGGGAVAGSGPAVTPPPLPVSEPTPPTIVIPPVTPVVPPPSITGPAPVGGVTGGAAAGGAGGSAGGAGGGGSGGGGVTAGSGVSGIAFRDARVVSLEERSLVLIWETDRMASGLVEYGTDDYRLRVTEEMLERTHTLRVNELQPDTLYQFRITARAGDQVVSRRITARTLPDVTPPTNPSDLRAIGQDGQVLLEWVNPVAEDFVEVIVVARGDRFATDPSDGREVYRGMGQGAVDVALLPRQIYYYAVFARDRNGNLSSGAIVSTQTRDALIPVPEGVATTTPGTSLPSQEPFFGIVRELRPMWSDESGSIVFQVVDGSFEAFSRQAIKIVVAGRIEGQRVERVEMVLAGSRYQFSRDAVGAWMTTARLPSQGRVQVELEAVLEDGSRARAKTSFFLKQRFVVVEEVSQQAASGTEIRVMRQTSDGLVMWDVKTSGQTNPFFTGVDGTYGFFVEPGTYRLFIRKEGFLSFDKEIVVKGNILGASFSLRVATPIEQVLANAREILESPVVQEVNKQVVAPVAVAVAVTNLTTAASASSVFRYLYFLFTQPLLLLRRRKRAQWGIVYNALSKQPVDLAIVRLLDSGTGRVVQTRITDAKGRYSFFVKPGAYRLQAVKQGFRFPTQYLAKDREDGALLDIYHGELVEVKQSGALVAANIPVDPDEVVEKTPKKMAAEKRFRVFQRVGASVGLVTSFGSFAVSPGWLTGGFFLFQVFTYAMFYRLAAASKPKDWGIVYDGASKRGLGQVVVRIFDKRFHKLLETQITDKDGKYAFFAGPNIYMLMADKAGYEAYHSPDLDLTKVGNPVISEKINLQPKKV